MNEQEILTQLRKAAEEIEIPETLKPEQIEKQLQEQKAKQQQENQRGHDQHAAHNGRRDAELFQQAAFFTQKLSQHQYHDRNGKGLVHIQLYDHAASSPAAMPFS